MVAGRATGLTEDKLAHIGTDPPPDGVFAPDELAVVRYARASSRLEPITDELYAALAAHFPDRQIIEICFTVGMSNMINRFHATFHTDVDGSTEAMLGAACPVPLPPPPG
ncbi:MAG: carboxymuconolactone decarboxylase family protein [Pseudonocardia sp.]